MQATTSTYYLQNSMIMTLLEKISQLSCKKIYSIRGSFFMFVESGCISTNIEFTVP